MQKQRDEVIKEIYSHGWSKDLVKLEPEDGGIKLKGSLPRSRYADIKMELYEEGYHYDKEKKLFMPKYTDTDYKLKEEPKLEELKQKVNGLEEKVDKLLNLTFKASKESMEEKEQEDISPELNKGEDEANLEKEDDDEESQELISKAREGEPRKKSRRKPAPEPEEAVEAVQAQQTSMPGLFG